MTKNQDYIIQILDRAGIKMYIPTNVRPDATKEELSIQATVKVEEHNMVSFVRPIVYIPYEVALKIDELYGIELLRFGMLIESFIKRLDLYMSYDKSLDVEKQYDYFYEFFNLVSSLHFLGQFAFIIGKSEPSEINRNSDRIVYPSKFRLEDTIYVTEIQHLSDNLFHKKILVVPDGSINVEIPDYEAALKFYVPMKSHTFPPRSFLDEFPLSIKNAQFIPIILETYDVIQDTLKHMDEININVLRNNNVKEKLFNNVEEFIPSITESIFGRSNEIFKSGLFPIRFDDINVAINSFTTPTVKTIEVSACILKQIFCKS